MVNYFRELIGGTISLATGLWITFKYMWQPVVTLQYPRKSVKMTSRHRSHIELTRNEETGESKCIVCGMCQRACPSNCITVVGEKPEGAKRKMLTKYILNYNTCSLCGLCVENCKPEAITFSKNYNLAGYRKEDFIMDLKQRFDDKYGKPEADQTLGNHDMTGNPAEDFTRTSRNN